ncbi:hypothetical protein Poli38472_008088 [Pythium oligandrum]|uniref:Transmembrane protein n=1 Tax=Pythium oligandrum TaxID=41045 RepID=A0A8K1FJY9_PYTOL|nr:hypothetical protein Poli38472_008088 [Pythium oligandrum]|eukprot:TMW65446.1 hypothetical protein Poli38472_008088 [Pythium oligandrum]
MLSPSPPHRSSRRVPDIVLLEESSLYPQSRQEHNDVHVLLPESEYPALQQQQTTRNGRPSLTVSQYSTSTGYQIMYRTPIAGTSKRNNSADTLPPHYGAFRPGGPVPLFTKLYSGLLLNWVIVGFFNGAIPALVYPLFYTFLHYESYQATAVTSLMDFGWYFKFLFGFISDAYSINRKRRKPYMYIGWTVFMGFMIAMACMHQVEPYMKDDEVFNADAPSQGPRYVVPFMISSFAHLLVTVACEGMMIEFAHREGEFERGRTPCIVIMSRFVGETSGSLFVSMMCNSAEYGGTFSFSMPLQWMFALFAVIAFIGILVTRFFLQEELLPAGRQRFATQLRLIWRFIEQRATSEVMISAFFISAALMLSVYEVAAISETWLHATTLTLNLSSIFQNFGYIIAAFATKRWFLNTNWRVTTLVSLTIASLIALPIELLTVFDVVRDSTLWLIKDQLAGIFEAFVWLIRLLIIIEIAEPGYEATTYGLLTTVCNLANAVVRSTYNVIMSSADPQSEVKADTNEVRWHIATEILVKLIGRLFIVLVVIRMLPRQKRHVREIKILGPPNLVLPIVVFTVICLLFVAAVTSSLLAIFKSTSCLKFAGGPGCK